MDALNNRRTGPALLSRIQLALVLAYYFIAFLDTSTIPVSSFFPLYSVLHLVLIAVILLIGIVVTGRALVTGVDVVEGRTKRLCLAAFRFALVICTILAFFFNVRSMVSWFLTAVAVTSLDLDERKLFERGFYLGVVLVAAGFVLSMLDLIENNRGTGFGFIYRTHYACHLLCMALAYCVARDGKLSWKAELGLVVITLLDVLFVQGKTMLVLMLALMFGTFWRHYKNVGGVPWQDRRLYGPVVPMIFRALYLPVRLLDAAVSRLWVRSGRARLCRLMIWSFVISAALIVLPSVAYRPLKPVIDRIPGFGTVKARLSLGNQGFEEFPVSIFGGLVPQQGLSNTDGVVDFYYALDSGYVKMLLEYGWVHFLVMIGLMTWTQVRLFRAKRYYAMFLLALFAIDNTMEYWIVSPGYNLFILLATCRLQIPEPWQRGTAAIEGPQKRGGALRRVLMAACAAAVCWWCATAYPISTWSGWTPVKDATIVVPGSYIDGFGAVELDAARMDRAVCYLETYEDARCILAGGALQTEGMRLYMQTMGIAPERLYDDAESASVDEMLANAQALIAREGLPQRMTVCTFKMQQYRVSNRAGALNIPVNSLPVDMPWKFYLLNYFMEQWKITL